MALSVQKFREIVFQILYSLDFKLSGEEDPLTLVVRQNAIPKKVAKEAMERAQSAFALKEEFDAYITSKANDYDLERVPQIEQAILRLGLYELLHDDLPPKVAISEAVRLSRKYATKEGATFVNAILDAVYKEIIDASDLEKQATL